MTFVRRYRVVLLILLVVLLVVAVACDKQPPASGHMAVAGDSVTFQGGMYGSRDNFINTADTYQKVGIGWKASHAQAQVDSDARTPDRSPEVIVFAFGQNEADGNVVTQDERNAWMAITFAPHDATCVVWVQPAVLASAPAGRRAVIAELRQMAADLVQSRPNSVIVDWQDVVNAHPEYLDPDGVHLNTSSNTAPDAYAGLMGNGATQC